VKRQPSEWEKIIANETTYKELISRIYKELIQLNTRKKKKQQQPNQKVGKRPKKRHFSKEDILILVDLLQKITEFCKVIILQLKKTISGKKKSNKFQKKKKTAQSKSGEKT